MRSGLELHDSRVSHIELLNGDAMIYFSHAYIHKSNGTPGRDRGTGWSQEARLVLSEVRCDLAIPKVPNTIAEGTLEVGGIKHEIIPLPFKRRVPATLWMVFINGEKFELAAQRSFVELLSAPIYLEELS